MNKNENSIIEEIKYYNDTTSRYDLFECDGPGKEQE